MNKYEQIMNHINCSKTPINHLNLKLKNHCECKLECFKKILNEFDRRNQSKHVSFDGSINLNNNNSSRMHTSSSFSQQCTYDRNPNLHKRNYHRKEAMTTSNNMNGSFISIEQKEKKYPIPIISTIYLLFYSS